MCIGVPVDGSRSPETASAENRRWLLNLHSNGSQMEGSRSRVSHEREWQRDAHPVRCGPSREWIAIPRGERSRWHPCRGSRSRCSSWPKAVPWHRRPDPPSHQAKGSRDGIRRGARSRGPSSSKNQHLVVEPSEHTSGEASTTPMPPRLFTCWRTVYWNMVSGSIWTKTRRERNRIVAIRTTGFCPKSQKLSSSALPFGSGRTPWR